MPNYRTRVGKDSSASTSGGVVGRGYLEDTLPFIEKGDVIPIISNSLRLEQIFLDEKSLSERFSDEGQLVEEGLTITEHSTQEWAGEINYPFRDAHDLARVAQYYQVEKETLLAKTQYLDFMTRYLLSLIDSGDPEYGDIADLMRKKIESFSRSARRLDFPRFPNELNDPLRMLAKLPLKIYITTSPYRFVEQALEAENKHPRTQVLLMTGGEKDVPSELMPDSRYEPTAGQPAVYHLFGLEDFPQTLVLSEDDFMNFLINMVEDSNTQSLKVPARLRGGISESRLLLLGYRVKDWEFRVLFRFLQKFRQFESAPKGMLIQLNQGTQSEEDRQKSIHYLSQYFDKRKFEVDITTPEKFIVKLWNAWEKYSEARS